MKLASLALRLLFQRLTSSVPGQRLLLTLKHLITVP